MALLSFISHYNQNAYFNMAFDEWLFEQVLKNRDQIYLRLYSWSDRGGITFGVNQQLAKAVDLDRADGIPIIRRITGGRAIYHDPSELTYSVALNSRQLSEKEDLSLSESSQKIAQMLVLFLDKAGIESHYVRKSSPENARPDFFHRQPCFESFAKYELASAGRKVIASAQRRFEGCLLQHGSIKLNPPVYHPALYDGNVNDKTSKALLPLEESRFNYYRDCLKEAAREFFKAELVAFKFTGSDQMSISAMEKNVKKNALAKREIIKHKSA